MTRRLLWVLLVLIGVLSMHGFTSVIGRQAVGAAGSVHSAVDVPVAQAAHHPVEPASVDGVPVIAAGQTPGPAGAPDHGALGHLWSLCLAVLAAVAGVALAVLARRRRPVGPRSGPRSLRGPLGGLPLLRPPELSVLCLLRI